MKRIVDFEYFTNEDAAPAAGGGFATLSGTPGMGAPVLAGRGITGSGDVTIGQKKKKRKKKMKNLKAFGD